MQKSLIDCAETPSGTARAANPRIRHQLICIWHRQDRFLSCNFLPDQRVSIFILIHSVFPSTVSLAIVYNYAGYVLLASVHTKILRPNSGKQKMHLSKSYLSYPLNSALLRKNSNIFY